MRASRVLQKCLPELLEGMHALRERALLHAVEAVLHGRRLTLIDVARSWPDAERIRPPLKAFDRLLGNRHLHAERETIHADMARWLLRGPQPVIVIDWTDLKADKSWCLLRAAVPVGGRTLTLLDMVFPGKEQGAPAAEKRFLQRLQVLVSEGVRPILVTDAGFRTPWFQAVSALGWHWLGRLRGWTRVKPLEVDDHPDQWVDCRQLVGQPNPAGTAVDAGQSKQPDHLPSGGVCQGAKGSQGRNGVRFTFPTKPLAEIRAYLQQQRALGGDDFKAIVEAKTRRFAAACPAHRPRRMPQGQDTSARK